MSNWNDKLLRKMYGSLSDRFASSVVGMSLGKNRNSNSIFPAGASASAAVSNRCTEKLPFTLTLNT